MAIPRRIFSTAAMRRLLPGALCLLLAACGGGGSSDSASSSTATPVISISTSPTATTLGQVVSLTWSASNASSCTASGGWSGTQATSGTTSVTPTAIGTTNYVLTCGSVSNTASVAVTAAVAPTVSLSLAPTRIAVSGSSTLTWSSANATACTASGSWSGSKATSGSVALTPGSTGTYTYGLTCTGSGGSADGSTILTVANNTATMVVDNGPSGAGGTINQPYVSVTVCVPGTTTCQTIDHVLVDTGSYGLRLIGPLNGALALPTVANTNGTPAGECTSFVSGYTWGAVRQADVTIGGETASAQSVQIIGDSGSAYATTPASCSNSGANLGTLAALGANGILGIGLEKQDCGASCVNTAVSGTYYGCTSSGCVASTMPLASQVSNPVSSFAIDNNGVLLVLPTVGSAGATSLTGTLIFGVGTSSNNALGSATVYKASSSGYFRTFYKGTTLSKSFIDSGSNGLFFADSTLTTCSTSTDFYCPSASTSLSAVNSAYDGSTSGTVSFTIVNADTLSSSAVAGLIGGPTSSLSSEFDWGLPFFFGRPIYIVIEGNTVSGSTGPFWAY